MQTFLSSLRLIEGFVERGEELFILIDVGPKKNEKLKKFSPSARYVQTSSGNVRFVNLIPMQYENYEKFKDLYREKIQEIKGKKIETLRETKYNASYDRSFRVLATKDLKKTFLERKKIKEFSDFIAFSLPKGARPLHEISEYDISKLSRMDKENLKAELESIHNRVYNHDEEWKEFIDKFGLSIAVVIPTLNEKTLIKNIKKIYPLQKAGLISEIIIADGFSEKYDPSNLPIEKKTEGRKPAIIKTCSPGKGGGLQAALKYAVFMNHDLVICVDADIKPIRIYHKQGVDFGSDFFVRKLLHAYIDSVKKFGKRKARGVFFKSGYMRIPHDGKNLKTRFGGSTELIKDFYHRLCLDGMQYNIYPLSGEYAFNPKHILENMSVTRNLFEVMNYSGNKDGSIIPSGFALEGFWNMLIETLYYDIYYVNMYFHLHTSRKKKGGLDSIARQRGEVLAGSILGLLIGILRNGDLESKEKALEFIKKIEMRTIITPRPLLSIKGKATKKKFKIDKIELREE